jgi:hypothetical protein
MHEELSDISKAKVRSDFYRFRALNLTYISTCSTLEKNQLSFNEEIYSLYMQKLVNYKQLE